MSALFAVLLALSAQGTNDAEQLFQRMEEKLAKAKTLECNLEIVCDFRGQVETLSYKGSLLLGEGNRARLEINEATKGRAMRVLTVSDGARLSYQDNGMSHPKLEGTPKNLKAEILTWMARSGVFLPQCPLPPVEATDFKDRLRVSEFRLGKKEKIGERETQRFEYQLDVKGQSAPISVEVWLDQKTGLPVKRMLISEVGKEKFTVVETYSKLTLDEKMDAKLFELPK